MWNRLFLYLGLALVPFAFQGLLTFVRPLPYPLVHDEFSYLFGAETLLAGRLSNPTPPSPAHFDTLHILIEPTWASRYPLAQSVFLALGKLVFGHPHWGVVLSISLACAAMAYAIRGLLPGSLVWPAMGGVYAFLAFGTGSYWIRLYHGGGVLFAASLLLLGAYARLRQRNQSGLFALAAGIPLAFFSRPLEGGILTLFMLAGLAMEARPLLRRTAAVVAAAGFFCFALQAFHNHSVTGDWKVMPHQAYQRQYSSSSLTTFLKQPPSLNRGSSAHRALERWELSNTLVREKRPWGEWWSMNLRELNIAIFPFRLTATAPGNERQISLGFFALLLVWPLSRFLSVTGLGLALTFTLTHNFFSPHYFAPLIAVLFLAHILLVERLSRWPKAGFVLAHVAVAALLLPLARNSYGAIGSRPQQWREVLEQRIREKPGPHLVFVRRGADFDVHHEPVYNSPNLDQAEIIWARDLDTNSNRALANRFPGRKIWLCRMEAESSRDRATLEQLSGAP